MRNFVADIFKSLGRQDNINLMRGVVVQNLYAWIGQDTFALESFVQTSALFQFVLLNKK